MLSVLTTGIINIGIISLVILNRNEIIKLNVLDIIKILTSITISFGIHGSLLISVNNNAIYRVWH